MAHYLAERFHQGLGCQLVMSEADREVRGDGGRVGRRKQAQARAPQRAVATLCAGQTGENPLAQRLLTRAWWA